MKHILHAVGILLVSCSTPRTSVEDKKVKNIYDVPQSFWVGTAPARERGRETASTCQDQEKKEHKQASTPLDALLTIVTLGIYSSPSTKKEPKTDQSRCP